MDKITTALKNLLVQMDKMIELMAFSSISILDKNTAINKKTATYTLIIKNGGQ